ncbi:class F sortase [Kineococcus sp. SYSU DK004]|uniref:class F sortase n=1 Tax=Kineococcus sp. SYSU DK004 TaxID=3383125 RepID=UPI003D7EAB88
MTGRARALLCAVSALAGLALVGAWWGSRPAEEFGPAAAAPPPAAVATSAPTAGPGAGPDPAARPSWTARPATPTVPVALPAPVGLRIPDLGVDAPLVDVGVRDDGAFDVPADGDVVGWYRWSAAPGGEGTTVVAGHVDTAAAGPGALYPLAGVAEGARVEVLLADGSTAAYEVVARRSVEKTALPLDEVFRRAGPHELVVVTCGGDFDPVTRSYEDNVVVRAQPVR